MICFCAVVDGLVLFYAVAFPAESHDTAWNDAHGKSRPNGTEAVATFGIILGRPVARLGVPKFLFQPKIGRLSW